MSDVTMEVGKETSTEEFEFFSAQFFMHAEKMNKIHKERNALMRYSVIGTFGYFGWLFIHPNVASPPGPLIISLSIWMIPFGFNIFGLWQNVNFLKTIEKHGLFLDYLVSKGMGCPNYFRMYLQESGYTNRKIHPSRIFWWAIIGVSLATGLFSVLTRSDKGIAILTGA